MHCSSLELGRKWVELNVCESFKYISQELFENNNCFSKVQFHHEGGLSQSRYFELFSQLTIETPPHKKISFD